MIWGDGSPKREVIFVDDIADACIFFMKKRIKQTIINIGTGKDYTIREYAFLINKIINPGKKLKIKLDKTKPNGTPRKVLNIKLAKSYGWEAKTDIKSAVEITYKDFIKKHN